MSARPRRRAPLRSPLQSGRALAIAVAVLGGSLSGCTASDSPTPQPSVAADPSARPSDSTGTEPAEPEPVLLPGGTADDNLPYFDLVNARLLGTDSMPGGRPIIDNLVAAGFDKTAMQVTPDATAIGRDADAVEFSVQLGEQCLIGQASGTGYVSTVGAVVPGAGCLIGVTRAIDW